MHIESDKKPRDLELPLFDPHVPSFTCTVEADKVPAIDAEADSWFQEARAMEDPEIFVEDRDYKQIVTLTRKAAERRHWKAMLNLASLYLEGRDPLHGEVDALRLVEDAVRLGVPAAYDRMGTFYQNGTGLTADATRAYAFWQKAAWMGNPDAMAFLAAKMVAIEDKPHEGKWSNIPVAIAMLECSLSQGYGPAAYDLAFEYVMGKNHPPTAEEKEKALKVLHEGTRFGCANCANKLYIEFDHPRSLSTMVAPFIDKARAERYGILGDALGFNPFLRFPNIDSVLPLPPAPLPPWNGDKDTLIEGAMGAKLPPRPVPGTAAPAKESRSALDSGFRLRPSGERTEQSRAPFAGYWQPVGPALQDEIRQALKRIPPGRYAQGEAFDIPYLGPQLGSPTRSQLVWEHCLTVDHDEDDVRPRAVSGLAREVQRDAPLQACAADKLCPATGIWQPWIDRRHPLRDIVNVYWRQAWLIEGVPFPDPRRDWMLDLAPELVTWHLMDRGIDINADDPSAGSGT